MYEGKNLNWLSLFIKVVIFVLFVLLAIWLITTIANKIGGNSFEENMNIMKEASINYFKEGNLPSEEGESKEVTLDELIKMKYITSFDKDCDREKSYSQATLVDDYYALRVELTCGSKKDYIYTSIDAEGNCIGDGCNKEEVEEKEEEKETEENNNDSSNESSSEGVGSGSESSNTPATGNSNNSSNNNTSTNNNNNGSKKLYYEYVKVNKVYGNWQYEKINGNNVETKNEYTTLNTYCKLNTKDYYVVVSKPVSEINLGSTYRIAFKIDIDPEHISYTKTLANEFFNNNISMYNNFINNGYNTEVRYASNAYGVINNADVLMNSSLKSNNLTFKNIYYYNSDNGMYVESAITFNNFDGVSKYNNKYFIPLHIKTQYKDMKSCITDTADNSSNYNNYEIVKSDNSNVTLYRSYTEKKEYKWSTEKSLAGYTATGNKEYR